MTTVAFEKYDDVLRIRFASFGSRSFGLDVSAYVVRGVMIDSAFHRARQRFANAINGLDLRGCIITHWHEDHAGNVRLLAQRGVPVSLRADTEAILRSGPRIKLYRQATWGRPPVLDTPITPFDTRPLECIHTPGHSADHQVVFDPETRTLFSGDLWLGIRARLMHPAEDPFQILESLRTVAALEPLRMFDAHRGLVEPAMVGLTRRIDWLAEAISTVERRSAEGWTTDEIVQRELGGETTAARLSQGEYTVTNFVGAVLRNGKRRQHDQR